MPTILNYLIFTAGGASGPGNAVDQAPWWSIEVGSWLGIVFLIWIAFWGYKQYKKKQKK